MKSFLGLTRDATTVWRSSLFTVRLVSLVMASIAFAGVLWGTEAAGPGLDVSSAAYLGAAESVVAGHGYRVPTARWSAGDSTSTLTHYPPGFSTAIALPAALGFPALDAARLVEAISAFVTAAVLIALAGDAAGVGTALSLGLALLVMPALVGVHLAVLSEPLFLALLALTLALMVAAPDAPLAIGLCAAGAMLVRYAGVSVVVAAAAWPLLAGVAWKERVQRAVLTLVPSALIGVAWWWVARSSAATAAPHLALRSGFPAALSDALTVTAGWLVPSTAPLAWGRWAGVVAGAAVAAVLVAGSRRAYRLWRLLPRDLPLRSSSNVPQMVAARALGACAVTAVAYLFVIVGARLVADGSFTFDARVLSPLFLIVTLAFSVAAASWWRSARPALRIALWGALAAWGVASFVVSRTAVRQALTDGAGLANGAWVSSPVLEWARANAAGRALYSNWPAAAWLVLGRPARGIPEAGDAATLRAFADTVAAHDGVVLAFTAENPAFIAADTLAARAGLRVLAAFPDGQVLGAAAPSAR